MQDCIAKAKQVPSHMIDWPEKLQITQDIKLFNDVLEALGPDPKRTDTTYMQSQTA